MKFIARECGMRIDKGVITAGASNANFAGKNHSFVFVANPNQPDPEGTYFEIDDQIYGGYQNVKSVFFYKNGVKIIFTKLLVQRFNYTELNVVINNMNDFNKLKEGITKVCNNNFQINEILEEL